MNCRWSTEPLHRGSLRLYNLDSSFLKLLPPLTAWRAESLKRGNLRSLPGPSQGSDSTDYHSGQSMSYSEGRRQEPGNYSWWRPFYLYQFKMIEFQFLYFLKAFFHVSRKHRSFCQWLFSLKTNIKDDQLRKEAVLDYLNTFTSPCFLIICPRRYPREQEVHYFLLKGQLSLS